MALSYRTAFNFSSCGANERLSLEIAGVNQIANFILIVHTQAILLQHMVI
jgi:hypothetical protein